MEAIRDSSLQEEQDSGAESLSARFALEGSGFAVGGRDAAWTAGVELGTVRGAPAPAPFAAIAAKNMGADEPAGPYVAKVTDVLGSGGVSYAGERNTAAAFAEMSVPLADRLDLRVAGRGVEYDDVGGLGSWRVGAEYRPTGIVALRGSWSTGEGSPSMADLYSTEDQDHPYIQCDPGTGDPAPRPAPRRTVGR